RRSSAPGRFKARRRGRRPSIAPTQATTIPTAAARTPAAPYRASIGPTTAPNAASAATVTRIGALTLRTVLLLRGFGAGRTAHDSDEGADHAEHREAQEDPGARPEALVEPPPARREQ